MKAIKNKSKTFCACSLIPGLHGKGKRSYKLTNRDCAIMSTFEEELEKYCFLDSRGECVRSYDYDNHHTKIGVKSVSHCKICGGNKWEVLIHPPFDELPLHRPNTNHPRHLLYFDPPELYTPNANAIIEENRRMQTAGDGNEH